MVETYSKAVKLATETKENIIKLWDDYSSKYNLLCDKLIKCKIDCKLLDEVIKAREKLGFSRM